MISCVTLSFDKYEVHSEGFSIGFALFGNANLSRVILMTEITTFIFAKFLYVILGGFIVLAFMKISCSMFNRKCKFNISDELGKGNVAVGLMVMGLFIGVSIALGLVIGIGLG